MFHPPCPLPQGPAALTPWCLGTTEQRPPGGYQAQLLCIASRRDSELPPRGDTSRHSSNLELFCPYQLVSAGLPDTSAPRVGPCLAVSVHRREGCHCPARVFPATEKGRLPGHSLVSPQGGRSARGPAPPSFQASSSAFFPGPTPGVWPEPEAGGPMGTHSCPVLHCRPLPPPSL